MIVTLNTSAVKSLDQIRAFLDGSEPVGFAIADRRQAYAWIAETLKRFRYPALSRPDKGVLRQYLAKVSGLSRQQTTRLIARFLADGRLEDRRGKPAKPFPSRYTPADILALAELDTLHGTLSGPATKPSQGFDRSAWCTCSDSPSAPSRMSTGATASQIAFGQGISPGIAATPPASAATPPTATQAAGPGATARRAPGPPPQPSARAALEQG
jgi:hypothetical protein